MTKMKTPTMEVVRFGNEDVIATSMPLIISGFGNSKKADASMKIIDNNPPTTFTTSESNPWSAAQLRDVTNQMKVLYPGMTAANSTQVWFYAGSNKANLLTLFARDRWVSNDTPEYGIYNGTYFYMGGNNFQKQ